MTKNSMRDTERTTLKKTFEEIVLSLRNTLGIKKNRNCTIRVAKAAVQFKNCITDLCLCFRILQYAKKNQNLMMCESFAISNATLQRS